MSTDSSICSAQQQGVTNGSEFYCLTAGQRSGLTAVTIFGFVSLLAVIYLFSAILWHAWQARRAGIARRLFADALDIFLLSLFVADLCQALGIVLEVQWLRDGIVQTGGLCSVQGALLNIGQAGVAMASLIITLYTFSSIWWGKELRNLYAAGIIGACWISLLLFVIISASVEKSQPFYAPTPFWCWINSVDLGFRIGGENLWLWLAFASSVLYIPLFFWSRGYITPPADGAPWYTFYVHSADENQVPSRISLQLIGSGLAYSIPMLPTSLARWIVLVHTDNKPFGKPEAQITLQAIFGLSGLVDVIIFRLTRKGKLLFDSKKSSSLANGDHPSDTASDISQDAESEVLQDDQMQEKSSSFPPLLSTYGAGVCLCVWLTINELYAVWIVFYIQSATQPNPRTAANITHSAWEGYYVMMYLFGFIWGCVNIFACNVYYQMASQWFEQWNLRHNKTRKSAFKAFWYSVHALIVLPLAVILALGPFFAPLVAEKIAQEQAWTHRCDSFPVEVQLTGTAFGVLGVPPKASFFQRQSDNTLSLASEYNLLVDLQDSQHLLFQPTLPSTQNASVSYHLNTSSFTGSCPGTDLCGNGTFDQTGPLSINITTAPGNMTTRLRTVDTVWYYADRDDAPSLILSKVISESTLGQVVVQSAVTKKGDCTILKMCSVDTDFTTLVPLGLILLHQNEYAQTCTIPGSN